MIHVENGTYFLSVSSIEKILSREMILIRLLFVCVPCCRRSGVRAARGLMIMINCQSVQVFKWLVV